MGALLPNPNDLEVIARLNQQFSGAQLVWIRAQHRRDPMFSASRTRTLRRAAWRLNIAPTSGARPAARWAWFLSSGLTQNNQDDIKTILREAMDNAAENIVGVLFDAVADNALQAGNYTVVRQQVLADTVTNDIFLKIVLHCGADIPTAQAGDSSVPPAEPGEVGGDHPSPFAKRRRTGTVTKRTKRGSRKAKKTTRKKKVARGKGRTKRK